MISLSYLRNNFPSSRKKSYFINCLNVFDCARKEETKNDFKVGPIKPDFNSVVHETMLL